MYESAGTTTITAPGSWRAVNAAATAEEVPGHQRRLRRVRDHDHVGRFHDTLQARDGLLDHRLGADDGEQLFGPLLPAQRPKAFADAAGHDDRPVHCKLLPLSP